MKRMDRAGSWLKNKNCPGYSGGLDSLTSGLNQQRNYMEIYESSLQNEGYYPPPKRGVSFEIK